MSIVLDILVLAIIALCIFLSVKRGFFKSVTSFAAGIVSLVVAYTFTPLLSVQINARFILPSISGGIYSTLASIAQSGINSVGETVYDLKKLAESSQFSSIVERCGADEDKIGEIMENASVGSDQLLKSVADAVAAPVAKTLSNVLAFILLFIVSLVVLSIAVWLIGLVFKLPVLKETDKTLGLVFGILCAVLFVQVFTSLAMSAINTASAAFPSAFSADVVENTIIFKLCAEYNIIKLITGTLNF